MKTIVFVILSILFLFGCRTQKDIQYVPVQTTKIEYQDRLQRDSIHVLDSVFIHQKGDTVWLERYKTVYKEYLKHDSVSKTDTIRVPCPVTVEKPVNYITGWQHFQIWLGRILLAIAALIAVWLILKVKK